MTYKRTKSRLTLIALICAIAVSASSAETVTMTPEQQQALENRKRQYEQQLAQEQAVANAQLEAARKQAEVQSQAAELAEDEALRAKVDASIAMADAMVSAAQAGFEKGAAAAERNARAARIEMTKGALENWTPPARYRRAEPVEPTAIQDPFGDTPASADATTEQSTTDVTQVADATPEGGR